jgi:hypothetical protein
VHKEPGRRRADRVLSKMSFVLALALFLAFTSACFARDLPCPVGVNVNSFQNFDAAKQQTIADQLKRSGVHFVRTSLRPDDKNMNLAKNLQSEGIGLVLVVGSVFQPNAPLRPADDKRHMRSAMPLSYADPELSEAYYQTVFDRLDAVGVTLAGIEVGNEINWPDFNGDFPLPAGARRLRLTSLPMIPWQRRSHRGFFNI